MSKYYSRFTKEEISGSYWLNTRSATDVHTKRSYHVMVLGIQTPVAVDIYCSLVLAMIDQTICDFAQL